jgi:hypothetical protein
MKLKTLTPNPFITGNFFLVEDLKNSDLLKKNFVFFYEPWSDMIQILKKVQEKKYCFVPIDKMCIAETDNLISTILEGQTNIPVFEDPISVIMHYINKKTTIFISDRFDDIVDIS